MKRLLLIFIILLVAGAAMAQKHVSDLVVSPLYSGGTIKWYDAATGGNVIPGTDLLTSRTYYASQTVNGVESTARLAVTAAVVTQAAPTEGTHTPSQTQVVWNWVAATGATGYKWGPTNVYADATAMGTTVTKIETGLTCGNSYTRYVWAFNATCVSAATTLTQTTSACVSIAYNFTNAGAAGNTGPTQTQINTDYSNTTLEGHVAITTQGIQEWTVPATGSYSIDARGAKGGGDGIPGNGAKMVGTVSLTVGQVLKIVVGQQGLQENDYADPHHAGGGGGGSFVYNNSNTTLLMVAGGGGGNGARNHPGSGGIIATNDSNTGTSGNGGTSVEGNSGAGYSGNGTFGSHNETSIAYSFLNGAVGGVGASGGGIGYGGFGGGGGDGYADGGGGGGYSGGNTQTDGYGGYGGGSYNSGTSQSNTSDSNSGHGQVIITKL